MDPNKLYAIQEVPGKGLGVVAATKIPKGTRIFCEAPILRVAKSTSSKENLSKSLSKDVTALSDAKRQAFFSLHNAFEDEITREIGIVRTNALPFGYDDSMGGIFIEASHINHACIPNAQNTWNQNLQNITIYAARDMEKGEEVTISYLAARSNQAERQRTLQKLFRFTCTCQLCCLPPDKRDLSDARMDEMQRLEGLAGNSMQMASSPLQALHDVLQRLYLCYKEGVFDVTVPRAYYDAFQTAIYNSDVARAKVFVGRACSARIILEGQGSPNARLLEALARDPTGHALYGASSQWSTSIDQISTDHSAGAFHAWLWKDEKMWPGQWQRQYTDLRDG